MWTYRKDAFFYSRSVSVLLFTIRVYCLLIENNSKTIPVIFDVGPMTAAWRQAHLHFTVELQSPPLKCQHVISLPIFNKFQTQFTSTYPTIIIICTTILLKLTINTLSMKTKWSCWECSHSVYSFQRMARMFRLCSDNATNVQIVFRQC